MAISRAAASMNASARTLADLKQFAKAEPGDAVKYLTNVEASLRANGKTAEADVVKGLLGQTDGLDARIETAADTLKAVFPETAADWGKVQLDRAGTVGYGTPQPKGPAQFISGTVQKSQQGPLELVTEGGRTLNLATSGDAAKAYQMSTDKLEGFLGDGRVSFMGTLAEDTKTFNVESYALNTDGKFDTFTFGRVGVTGETVNITTSRGIVEVPDAELAKVLKTMPMLAVIVPGGFEKNAEGKLVHQGKAEGVLMALARFKELAPQTGTGTVSVKANMADNHFVMKPLSFPAEQLDRARHTSRLWVRGWPEFDAAGAPSAFNANYLSKQLDRHTALLGGEKPHADEVQAAVMHEIV